MEQTLQDGEQEMTDPLSPASKHLSMGHAQAVADSTQTVPHSARNTADKPQLTQALGVQVEALGQVPAMHVQDHQVPQQQHSGAIALLRKCVAAKSQHRQQQPSTSSHQQESSQTDAQTEAAQQQGGKQEQQLLCQQPQDSPHAPPAAQASSALAAESTPHGASDVVQHAAAQPASASNSLAESLGALQTYASLLQQQVHDTQTRAPQQQQEASSSHTQQLLHEAISRVDELERSLQSDSHFVPCQQQERVLQQLERKLEAYEAVADSLHAKCVDLHGEEQLTAFVNLQQQYKQVQQWHQNLQQQYEQLQECHEDLQQQYKQLQQDHQGLQARLIKEQHVQHQQQLKQAQQQHGQLQQQYVQLMREHQHIMVRLGQEKKDKQQALQAAAESAKQVKVLKQELERKQMEGRRPLNKPGLEAGKECVWLIDSDSQGSPSEENSHDRPPEGGMQGDKDNNQVCSMQEVQQQNASQQHHVHTNSDAYGHAHGLGHSPSSLSEQELHVRLSQLDKTGKSQDRVSSGTDVATHQAQLIAGLGAPQHCQQLSQHGNAFNQPPQQGNAPKQPPVGKRVHETGDHMVEQLGGKSPAAAGAGPKRMKLTTTSSTNFTKPTNEFAEAACVAEQHAIGVIASYQGRSTGQPSIGQVPVASPATHVSTADGATAVTECDTSQPGTEVTAAVSNKAGATGCLNRMTAAPSLTPARTSAQLATGHVAQSSQQPPFGPPVTQFTLPQSQAQPVTAPVQAVNAATEVQATDVSQGCTMLQQLEAVENAWNVSKGDVLVYEALKLLACTADQNGGQSYATMDKGQIGCALSSSYPQTYRRTSMKTLCKLLVGTGLVLDGYPRQLLQLRTCVLKCKYEGLANVVATNAGCRPPGMSGEPATDLSATAPLAVASSPADISLQPQSTTSTDMQAGSQSEQHTPIRWSPAPPLACGKSRQEAAVQSSQTEQSKSRSLGHTRSHSPSGRQRHVPSRANDNSRGHGSSLSPMQSGSSSYSPYPYHPHNQMCSGSDVQQAPWRIGNSSTQQQSWTQYNRQPAPSGPWNMNQSGHGMWHMNQQGHGMWSAQPGHGVWGSQAGLNVWGGQYGYGMRAGQ